MSRTLDQEPAGARVVVEEIGGTMASRLAELGVVAGCGLEIMRFIPLGGPVVLDRDGFRFAIRRSDAAKITVYSGDKIGPPKPDPASAEGGVE